jgi:tripartite-type tricarboxylate transporter receptor subunit TctC
MHEEVGRDDIPPVAAKIATFCWETGLTGGETHMRRRQFLRLALPAIAGLLPIRASAQLLEQPIRIIFPFAAGGSGDMLARLVADKMRAALGRAVIVENRTGGAGRIGVTAVKNAAPNGSTLLITPIAPMAVYQHVYKSLGYDPINDFAAVSQLATFDFGLAVGPQVPAHSLAELVAWVKADPGRTAYGGPSNGDLPHFLGVLFGRFAGLELRHVAYRGAVPAITDLIAGQIPIVIAPLSDLAEMHKTQRVRILASSGKERSQFSPDVPTFREDGYDIEGTSWYGAFAPAKTPAGTIDSLSTIMATAVRAPDVSERLLAFGLVPTGNSAAELAAIQKSDTERWASAVKLSGFTADE